MSAAQPSTVYFGPGAGRAVAGRTTSSSFEFLTVVFNGLKCITATLCSAITIVCAASSSGRHGRVCAPLFEQGLVGQSATV